MTRCRLIVADRIICGKKLRHGDEVNIPESKAVDFLEAHGIVKRLDAKRPGKPGSGTGGSPV